VEEVKDKSNEEIDINSWTEEDVDYDYTPLQQNGYVLFILTIISWVNSYYYVKHLLSLPTTITCWVLLFSTHSSIVYVLSLKSMFTWVVVHTKSMICIYVTMEKYIILMGTTIFNYFRYDCGMFMLKYMDFLSRGASLSFGQVSILDNSNVSRMDTIAHHIISIIIWAYFGPTL
jgi:hypothetical protein